MRIRVVGLEEPFQGATKTNLRAHHRERSTGPYYWGLVALGGLLTMACRPVDDGGKREQDSGAPSEDGGEVVEDSGDGFDLDGVDMVRWMPSVGIDCPADLYSTNFLVRAIDVVDPVGEGLEYRWKLVSAPEDAGRYEPPGNHEAWWIWPGLAGDYVLSLRVVDVLGRSSPVVTCETAAVPSGALFMELFWWSEGVEAWDLDLSLAYPDDPAGESLCDYLNPTHHGYDLSDPSDDCLLRNDDRGIGGLGLETMAIIGPAAGRVRPQVGSLDSYPDLPEDSMVSLRVWWEGTPIYAVERPPLLDTEDPWAPVEIELSSGEVGVLD
jgi:hypothetical protein